MIEPIAEMLRQGGWVLFGVAGLSVVAWTLIFWEWLALKDRTLGGWRRIDRAVEDLESSRSIDRQALSRSNGNLVAGLLQSRMIEKRMDRRSFEAQILPLLSSEATVFRQAQRNIAVLAACMPLLGLLGTVVGMMQTFDVLTERGVANVDALAGGISQALITTQAGLVVAVPVLLVNGYLGARIRRYLDRASVMVKKIETAICDE